MSDYSVLPGDDRTPLMRAFVGAFEHATNARAALARSGAADTLEPPAYADALAEQLAGATRRLAREAMAWTGAAGEADIAAVQYAFVALLDEQLLFSDWPGSSAWDARPLETRIFGTRAAGERLPDAIEALLAQRDPAQRDLANVYLACLTLGFKGRLRGAEGALRHDQLRHALFAFAMQRDAQPTRVAAPLERTGLAPRRAVMLTQMFPDVARFMLLLAVGICVLLGISHGLWEFAAARVRPALEQFQAVAIVDLRPPATAGTSVSGVVMRVPAAARAPGAASTAAGAAPGAEAGEADGASAPAAVPQSGSQSTPQSGAWSGSQSAPQSGAWSGSQSAPQSRSQSSSQPVPQPPPRSTPPSAAPAAPTVETPSNAALVVRTVVPAPGGTR
ncbi:MAG TPA: DotU family type IV/VI secretion system protein [Paraburkholderia sp.]|jgi:type IV/VI secretion system ImpK/VasF family protein|nr:DotU family type IV/VI secretion system protein [Paraburkholderia sp.]